MIARTPSGASSPGLPRGSCGVALQPVVDIQDRKPIAYEALPRPASAAGSLAVIDAALAASRLAGPAVVLIPLPERLVLDPAFDPAERGRSAGVTARDIAWLMPDGGTRELREARRQRAEELRSRGYLVALGGVGFASIGQPAVATLKPSFVILERRLTEHLAKEERARAELAGLLAFFARLGGRVIARGVDDAETARSVLGLGVQLGMGIDVGLPVIVDGALAEGADEVVAPSWFRRRSVRTPGQSEDPERRDPDDEVGYDLAPAGLEVSDRDFARTLGHAGRLLQAEHDPARILAVIADLLPRVLPVDRLAIFEADWATHRLVPRLARGEGLDGLFDMDDTMGTGITGSAFLRGEPYNCANTEDQAEAVAVPGSPTPEAESLLVIPMIAGDHRLGAIDLWRDGAGRFSELEVERAALFGYVTAAAWRNAQLYEELESRAMTDTLTGLLNIRWWHELAPREAAQSLRGGAEIGVLMVDLDHFKVVNDQCGHSVGDQVLRNVAGVLRSTLRSGDAALRYGGEEFLLVLRDTDTEGAIRVAESVRTRLSELESPGPGISRITASIGIAFYPRHGSELDDVVQAADMAMYKAKEAGRNRVVLAPEPSPALVDD